MIFFVLSLSLLLTPGYSGNVAQKLINNDNEDVLGEDFVYDGLTVYGEKAKDGVSLKEEYESLFKFLDLEEFHVLVKGLNTVFKEIKELIDESVVDFNPEELNDFLRDSEYYVGRFKHAIHWIENRYYSLTDTNEQQQLIAIRDLIITGRFNLESIQTLVEKLNDQIQLIGNFKGQSTSSVDIENLATDLFKKYSRLETALEHHYFNERIVEAAQKLEALINS